MAEKNFKLKVFTPQGLVLDVVTETVTMPGIDGEVGILPEHAQYVGVLGAGVLQYGEPASSKTARLVIAGGFASFQVNELIILADAVDFEKDIAGKNVDAEVEQLNQRLSEINAFDPEWALTQQKIKRLEAIRTIH